MPYDVELRTRRRQDLLEAMHAGMCGAPLSPMPGVMMEMLEFAAMERRQTQGAPVAPIPVTDEHLTRRSHQRPIPWLIELLNRAAQLVADKLRSGSGARKLRV